ncbi:MAG: hypothetical protein HY288_08225 [Planctomycetia bacterium]|nr:hypothetical protein [Planctomycetia bacterium]
MAGPARLTVGLLFVLIFGVMAIGRADDISEAMRGDAQLVDACFIDAACGWAVGDRGVIWHTTDGGKHWEPQNSLVDCRLASVFFLDAKIGWAAGGYTRPYGETTTGVVLRTRDGGQHWIADRRLVLPAVGRIRFFDATHGWAIGQGSAFFPSGVFATDDGGRTWSALPGEESRSWLAGDFIDPATGALAGRNSTLAVVRRKGVVPRAADYGLRAIHDLKLVAPAKGWLVGDGGLVLKTRDLGNSWQTPDGEIPAAIRNQFDFSALAVRGEHCWVAGTPGTRVLHTADGGRTWNVCDTGQTLPIQHLVFVDEQSGWAVGDLGTILATNDGGQTWRRQRGGGTRSAFVGFYSSLSDIPLELIARLSADDGYLGAMEILNREDVGVHPAGGDAALKAHEASVLAGGSASGAAWRFPLRPASLKLSAEQLVDGWNQANDGQAVEKLEAHVVARIRMWRPSVVFTAAADARTNDPLAHVVNQIVLRAVERAADPKSFAEQFADAGLQPWKVQKVYGTLAAGQIGTANVNTAQFAARLGCSIGELAAPARAVVATRYVPPIANVGFRLLVDHIPQELGQRDFFSGIALSPGGDARRRFDELPDRNLDAMRRAAKMRRNLQAILAQADKGDGRDGRFLADIGEQTRTMQPSRAVDVLFQLAERYYHQGRWELAAECFDLIVARYPNHPLTGRSLVWLVQYHASSEAAWRNRAPQQLSVQQVTAQAPIVQRDKDNSFDGEPGHVQQAGAISAAADVQRGNGLARDLRQGEGRLAKATAYAKQIEQLQPALFAEPAVRFPLAVTQRQQGLPRQAERYFVSLRHSRPRDAWWACAQTELWLGEPKGQPPKPLWNCARAQSKPRLDGRLDEPLWLSGNSVELHSPQRDDAEWGAVAMLAYDEEFLYVAVSCTQAAGFKYEKSSAPRPRDPDLADQDRIELLLDIDRDFATYYRLSIDHRGWTGESCWQDLTWNPNWFVASGSGDGTWTAEAAIPLSELAGQPPTSKHAWAVGVQRVVPGVGFQSWTTPASTDVMPEGFGFLIFE